MNTHSSKFEDTNPFKPQSYEEAFYTLFCRAGLGVPRKLNHVNDSGITDV